MSLSKEQISQLKKQLFEQIKHLPENQRKEAEKQIENLSDKAIEEMLESQNESQMEIFREIVSGKIQSKKIDENKEAIAVLEIKPISRGHVLVIPKEKLKDISKIPNEIAILIDKVSKLIIEKLKPKDVKIIPELKLGEVIINIIPVYEKDLNLESERSIAKEEELDKIMEAIKKKQEIQEKKSEDKKEELKRFPRRIP
ncbi:MAG: HIT domain-containing protein [Candidatus Pacearchaeota archaeon]